MKKMGSKAIVVALAGVLAVGGVVGGTIAWLTDVTPEVKNTFTVGNIDIDLTETTGPNYKMVPGAELEKNPVVSVDSGSEACWLFVKVVENLGSWSDNKGSADFLAYSIDTSEGWAALDETNYPGVYYIQVDASTAAAGATYQVLADNKVTVSANVTKADMNELELNGATLPTLTFTAYAVQQANLEGGVAAAWDQVKNLVAATA